MSVSVYDTSADPFAIRSLWAKSIVESKKFLSKTTPSAVELSEMITGVTVNDTIDGSSTMTVELFDDGLFLVDSGFFDVDDNGKLDAIEVNYPARTEFWWRVTQVSIDVSLAGAQVSLTFMERAAVYLQELRGPVKVSRAKKTRAEFIKQLVDGVKKSGGLKFYSEELHRKQLTETQVAGDSERKTGGLSLSDGLRVKGARASRAQLQVAEQVLLACVRYNATPRATLALVAAVIVETEMKNNQGSGADRISFGVIQAIPGRSGKIGGGSFTQAQAMDIDFSVKSILKFSATSFENGLSGGGGLIGVSGRHKDWTVGRVAAMVINGAVNGTQGSSDYVGKVNKYKPEAEKIIAAFGGIAGTGGNVGGGSYNFEVGSSDNPRETYWDAISRLAEEVNWSVFVDGDRVYYDDDYTLIRQKPVLVVKRGSDYVLSMNGTWDARNVATELSVQIVSDPFEFRAGQVIEFQGYGPFSSGSTAKLPGRWLVAEIERDVFTRVSSVTLRQPSKPNPEPASSDTPADPGSSVGADLSADMTAKQVIDNIVLPIARDNGINRSVAQNDAANRAHGPTVSQTRSDHQGPPSVRWAADMSNGSAPTKEMDALAKALAQRFGLSWSGSGVVSGSKSGFRFQMLYRTATGGNHYNHVHLGVAKQ